MSDYLCLEAGNFSHWCVNSPLVCTSLSVLRALKAVRGPGLLISLEIPVPQRLRKRSLCGLGSNSDSINTYLFPLDCGNPLGQFCGHKEELWYPLLNPLSLKTQDKKKMWAVIHIRAATIVNYERQRHEITPESRSCAWWTILYSVIKSSLYLTGLLYSEAN